MQGIKGRTTDVFVAEGDAYCSHDHNCVVDEAMYKEYTNDSPNKVKVGGIKYDAGKVPVYRGAVSYFPRALEEVAAVSQFGASKYAWKGWKQVDDGINRYSDALVRHVMAEGRGEVKDTDSGLLHAAHAAWNALARLELMIENRYKDLI